LYKKIEDFNLDVSDLNNQVYNGVQTFIINLLVYVIGSTLRIGAGNCESMRPYTSPKGAPVEPAPPTDQAEPLWYIRLLKRITLRNWNIMGILGWILIMYGIARALMSDT